VVQVWSLTLREEHKLRVFENKMLKIFRPRTEEDGSWRKYLIMNFITSILHRILLG